MKNAGPSRLESLGTLDVPGLHRREVRIYVPPGASARSRRPTLYLFDGQNVFDDAPSFAGGWRVHESLDRMAAQGFKAPLVVAIHHGGDARIAELAPWPFGQFRAQAESFLEWIARGLIPLVDRSYPTLQEPAHRFLGGSSMGGLAALYGHLRYPEAFGGAMSMSPAYWMGGPRLFDFVSRVPKPWRTRIYIDCGALESRGQMLPLAERMFHQLGGQGWADGERMWRPDKRGTHNERHWKRRFPKAVRFLLKR